MLQINVASAISLNVSQKKKLEIALQKKYPKVELAFFYQINEELIAGLNISVAGKLYDTSLRARLNKLATKI